MKKQLLEYINRGKAMTCDELAELLNISPDMVRRNSLPGGSYPRIPGLRFIRFDPEKILEVISNPLPPPQPPEPSRGNRSMTTEKRNFSGNPKGGFRKCL